MFFVDPGDIKSEGLPYWLKGCNQVGRPHAEAMAALRRKGLLHLMRNVTVPTIYFGRLVREQRIRSIGMLKIDVEGYEGPILTDVQRLCEQERRLCPRAVMFETTHMAKDTELAHQRRFIELGYLLANPNTDHRDRVYVKGATLGSSKALTDDTSLLYAIGQ